jgi:hypothetical protein
MTPSVLVFVGPATKYDIKYVVLCMHAPTTKYDILYVVLRVQGLPQSTYDIKYVVLFTCVLGLCWWYGSKRESPPERGAPRGRWYAGERNDVRIKQKERHASLLL